MNEMNSIHDELLSAGQDLDRNLSGDIPPFKPRSDMPARIAVVAATLVVAGIGIGGFLRLSGNSDEPEVEVASENIEPEFDSSNGQPEEEATSDDPLVVEDDSTNPDDSDPDSSGESGGSDGSVDSGDFELPKRDPIVVPESLTVDLPVDSVYRPRTSLERPTTRQAVRDDEFGVSIQAITEAGSGGVLAPPANTPPAWNVDSTWLVLYRTGASPIGHILYDGKTFQPIRQLDINPLDVQEIYWDPTDANRFYYVDKDGYRLISFDVEANVGTEVYDFACDELNGLSFRRLSADGRTFSHNCTVDGQHYFVVVDLVSGVVQQVATDSKASPQPTPSSGLFVVNDGAEGTHVLDSSLTRIRSLPLNDYSDGVVIETADKRDLFISAVYDSETNSTGSVVAFDLATGLGEVIVGGESGYPFPPSNTAMTVGVGGSLKVAVSIVGTGSATGTLDGELLVVDFGFPDPIVYRLGHHRTANTVKGSNEYFTRPGIALDGASNRLLFASSWGGDRVDTFIIDVDDPSE